MQCVSDNLPVEEIVDEGNQAPATNNVDHIKQAVDTFSITPQMKDLLKGNTLGDININVSQSSLLLQTPELLLFNIHTIIIYM